MMLHYAYAPIVMRSKRSIPLGTSFYHGFTADKRYIETLKNYQIITPEVSGGWWWIYGEGHGFGDMDAIYQYAGDHVMTLIGYPLRWWFGEQPEDPLGWIEEMMTRYPLITDWIVVNEGFWDGLETIPLIRESYQQARKVSPYARLQYNGLFIQGSECDQVLGMVDDGLIDCVGIECHHNLTSKIDGYIPLICELNSRGIAWRVSELDVEIPNTSDECLRLQAEKYADVVTLVTDYNGESITVWGVADCVSWLPTYPLPFDKEYKPKPAWAALRQ